MIGQASLVKKPLFRAVVFGLLSLAVVVALGLFQPFSLSGPTMAWGAEGAKSAEGAENADANASNEVVETAIAVDPPATEATSPDQTAKDKKAADEVDQGTANNTTSDPAVPPDADVSTNFGLPADSPLFSGIEEDVDVESSKAAESSEDSGADAAASNAATAVSQASDGAEGSPDSITLVPDDDWLARGNAVLPLQLPDSSFIYDTSIQELSNADPYLDNQTVQVTGEAIGESIRASIFGRSRWVTLSPVGDSATISVFMSEESAAKIDSFGRYGVRGSILRVRGTFYLVCPEHDGATDLHAEEVTVVKQGESVHESFNIQAFVPGIILVAIGLLMVFVFSHISERRR